MWGDEFVGQGLQNPSPHTLHTSPPVQFLWRLGRGRQANGRLARACRPRFGHASRRAGWSTRSAWGRSGQGWPRMALCAALRLARPFWRRVVCAFAATVCPGAGAEARDFSRRLRRGLRRVPGARQWRQGAAIGGGTRFVRGRRCAACRLAHPFRGASLRARGNGRKATKGRSLCSPRAARAACPTLAVEGGGARVLATPEA